MRASFGEARCHACRLRLPSATDGLFDELGGEPADALGFGGSCSSLGGPARPPWCASDTGPELTPPRDRAARVSRALGVSMEIAQSRRLGRGSPKRPRACRGLAEAGQRAAGAVAHPRPSPGVGRCLPWKARPRRQVPPEGLPRNAARHTRPPVTHRGRTRHPDGPRVGRETTGLEGGSWPLWPPPSGCPPSVPSDVQCQFCSSMYKQLLRFFLDRSVHSRPELSREGDVEAADVPSSSSL